MGKKDEIKIEAPLEDWGLDVKLLQSYIQKNTFDYTSYCGLKWSHTNNMPVYDASNYSLKIVKNKLIH